MAAIWLPALRTTFAMPHLGDAVYQATLLVQATWVMLAQQAGLPSHYAEGIQSSQSVRYPDAGDLLAGRVVNVAPHADAVEQGRPSYHLPAVIAWPTPKTKRSAAGTMYLTIPFRHARGGRGSGITHAAQRRAMPAGVARVAARLTPTIPPQEAQRLGIPAQRGQYVTAGRTRGQAVHAHGMQAYVPRFAPNVRPGYTHASIHEGLRKTGAQGHSQYLTFRTLTPASTGWHIPARPGAQLIPKVIQQTQAQVAALLIAAAQQDVRAYVATLFGGQQP